MTVETLLIGVVALLLVAVCTQFAPKVGVASPPVLLGLGIGIGFLPIVSAIEVPPAIVLEVVLPPLLFSAATAMPVMDFRRELISVAGLAVGLVVLSAVVVGFVVHAVVPAVSWPWAIALGAVLSPTDAVAIAIARRLGVSHRIITILEGEGLFNDATALVLLSSAVAAGLATNADALRPGSLAIGLAVALTVAVVIDLVVGELMTRLCSRIDDPSANTVISFTVPFLAAIPAEHLGGSGLVAAVVAGLVTSVRAPTLVPPANRRTAQQNWHTIELILEGGVFLAMGLQAYGIVQQVTQTGGGLRRAAVLAVIAATLTVVLRAAFVAPLLAWLHRLRIHSTARHQRTAERISSFEDRLAHASDIDPEVLSARDLTREDWGRALARWRQRLDRYQRRHQRTGYDLAYFVNEPLGPREGAVIVWAGMRGAVTLAAAQTLPLETPQRPFLLLVALLVAAGSLVIQGLTLPLLVRLVRPLMASPGTDAEERRRVIALLGSAVKQTALAQALAQRDQAATNGLSEAGELTRSFSTVGRTLVSLNTSSAEPSQPADEVPVPAQTPDTRQPVTTTTEPNLEPLTQQQVRDLAVEAIRAQRRALLEARDEGVFSSATLSYVLERLDAEEIMLTH